MKFRYKILLEKNEILLSTSTKSLPKKQKFHYKQLLPRQPTTKKKESLNDKTFIFKSQGRTKPLFATSETPPPGYYNCSYSLVHKSPASITIPKNTKKKSIVPPVDKLSTWAPSKKLTNISFKKQLSRKEHFIKELNENRFLNFEIPTVCTKYKKAKSPDISKFSFRKNLIKSVEFLPSYQPNYKIIKENTGKVHEFSKYIARKPLFLTRDEDDYFYLKENRKQRKWEDYWANP